MFFLVSGADRMSVFVFEKNNGPSRERRVVFFLVSVADRIQLLFLKKTMAPHVKDWLYCFLCMYEYVVTTTN